jgi:predicted dehydrogenase
VRGQYHARQTFETLPAERTGRDANRRVKRHVGILGCGNFAYSHIAYYLKKNFGSVIRGVMDPSLHKAASLFEAFDADYYTTDASRIIADPTIDLVFIASNHASHAEYAIACIEAGKHVHIEKPHVVTADQLERLTAAMKAHPESKVFLGFNRPRSRLFRLLREQLDRESGPLMINWFIAGHEIEAGHWYFDEREGGRVLGNLCHWTDLTLHLVGLANAFPCTIVPATPEGAQSDFVVSVMFADRSCASITFSAKGHTFEGVREVLNVHRGNVLANLTDFERLSMERVAEKINHRLMHRDHGHRTNLLHSLSGLRSPDEAPGEKPAYVEATARFFLAIREAIDSGGPVVLSAADAMSATA